MRDAEGARLREPLAIILGWSELLRSGRLQGDDVRIAIDAIVRNARAQAELIDELLSEGDLKRRRIS
jgi:signal transduction histidine kinase